MATLTWMKMKDDFAELVFAACDIDSETNIHIDHQNDECMYFTMRVYMYS